ncbi:MAG: 16S rRNA (cytidine(1402)-2'-O)-methyltransferase [Acidobacteriota bacterium]|nr:MAG: 16S rRNA (cytidine(1402)-2'-O)-methyltransferase [Acidobacteriota bacterium]
MPGTLYLVATPIGNLRDITYRALDILHDVDVIACEDTRHSQKLLNHYRISNRTISFHEHNENERGDELLEMLRSGSSVAVVSDAGTPAINDPGYNLVKLARDAGIAVVPIPGPSAVIAALIASGLPTDSFFFGGFLPSKKGNRIKRLTEVKDIPATLIFFETPHRISRAIGDCIEVLGDRNAVIARELTKVHETFSRGRLSELPFLTHAKGEMVLLIERASDKTPAAASIDDVDSLIEEFKGAGFDEKAAIKKAAKQLGIPKSEVYRRTKIKK